MTRTLYDYIMLLLDNIDVTYGFKDRTHIRDDVRGLVHVCNGDVHLTELSGDGVPDLHTSLSLHRNVYIRMIYQGTEIAYILSDSTEFITIDPKYLSMVQAFNKDKAIHMLPMESVTEEEYIVQSLSNKEMGSVPYVFFDERVISKVREIGKKYVHTLRP